MDKIRAMLPRIPFSELKWESYEPTPAFPYRWKVKGFDNLRLESPVPDPFGQVWEINFREDKGRYLDGGSYGLNMKLQLHQTTAGPTHFLEWFYSTGKYLKIPRCDEGLGFTGKPHGWLFLKLQALKDRTETPNVVLPQVKVNRSEATLAANVGLSDEERRENSIRAVQDAVAILAEQDGWKDANVRQRMALIKAQVCSARGFGISAQTLYRDEIKPIWKP